MIRIIIPLLLIAFHVFSAEYYHLEYGDSRTFRQDAFFRGDSIIYIGELNIVDTFTINGLKMYKRKENVLHDSYMDNQLNKKAYFDVTFLFERNDTVYVTADSLLTGTEQLGDRGDWFLQVMFPPLNYSEIDTFTGIYYDSSITCYRKQNT